MQNNDDNNKKNSKLKNNVVSKKIKGKLKWVAIKFILPIILIIIAAALVLGLIEAAIDAVMGVIDSNEEKAIVDENDGRIIINDTQVDTILNAIDETGIDPADLWLLGDIENKGNYTQEEYQEALRKYVRKFIESQYATETLNYYHKESTDDATYGSVYVYRVNESDTDGTSRRELHYISYDAMKQLVDADSKSALNYFSIDDSDNLVIANKTQVIVETGTSESNLTEISNEISIGTVNLEYKSAISQYTTKMMFLMDLLVTSQNPEFTSAVTDLIRKSKIELTIMDSVTTFQDIQTNRYDWHVKVKNPITTNSTLSSQYSTTTTPGISSTKKTTTITTSPSMHITYVRTWFCEQTIEYKKGIGAPIEEGPFVERLKDESPPSGEGSWKTNITNTNKTITQTNKYSESNRTDVTFILGEKGDGQKYKDGTIEIPTFVGLMETPFRIPNTNRYSIAGGNLISSEDFFFSLLQKDPDLENVEILMKYAFNKYLGYEKYNVDLDGSIFSAKDFTTAESKYLDLSRYLRQFSHSSEAPQSADGRYYLMYGDGVGWPTIGNADIQWKSHYTDFAVPGKVLENGVEKEVADVASYVNGKLGRGATAEYTNEEISKLQIYIEKELVDSIGENLVNVYYKSAQDYTAGLSLSQQQLYALTAISYNFGHLPVRNGKTFVEVYQEASKLYQEKSWQHNMYVWDNWWCLLGGGAAGHIPARDAAFETYVKGVIDFSTSDAGTVFSRKYYIYYTSDQLAQFDYAPDKSITRTTANEEEIFTYEEGAVGDVLMAADKLHQEQVNWSYSVGGDLFWNNIEMSISNPNQVTCCATYVSSALYVAGYFTESEMNSFNYNSSNSLYNYLIRNGWETIKDYSDMQPGDIVFMDNTGNKSEINHVQIYAGNDLWYNAGSNDAIQGSAPLSQGSWATSSFFLALRRPS